MIEAPTEGVRAVGIRHAPDMYREFRSRKLGFAALHGFGSGEAATKLTNGPGKGQTVDVCITSVLG